MKLHGGKDAIEITNTEYTELAGLFFKNGKLDKDIQSVTPLDSTGFLVTFYNYNDMLSIWDLLNNLISENR
jgi:hypothetical protein